jgi:hypothetical protein
MISETQLEEIHSGFCVKIVRIKGTPVFKRIEIIHKNQNGMSGNIYWIVSE